ncbi:SH3 domain-containing protein [Streptomyces sp. NPDC047880]|uniref:SH3 domain-containing protein n=1 Tax=unclassified Streptomyces TaxID=2593676 RepID=UPI00345543BC
MKKIISQLLAIAAATVAIPALLVTPAAAADRCGEGYADKDSSAWRATGSGGNIRSGPSTSCSIVGKASSGHRLDYHCYLYLDEAYFWTYLRDDSTGKYGWVRGDLLSDHGSLKHC